MSIGTIDIHTYNQYFNIGLETDNLNDYEFEDLNNERNSIENVPIYTEAFPALPIDVGKNLLDVNVPWNNNKNSMSIRSSIITQVFSVPLEDRQLKTISKDKIYQNIMDKTNVVIETSQSKDSSLSIVMTGKQENIIKARKLLLPQLQVQVQIIIQIPKEYHRYLLGAKGKKLAQIENDTTTKISLPKMGARSDNITIMGNKYGVEKAKEELFSIYEEQAKLASLQLDIPKCYHIFICGVGNENVKKISEKNGVRIIVPPYHSTLEQIFISGEKQSVLIAEAEIEAIYNEKRNTCQEISVQVKKSQHKYLIGPKGVNINEIFAETGVSVIVPPQGSDSELVLLRGSADKLGVALTSIYAKANSMILEEVEVPNWLHRFIIGQHGSEIKKITENYPKVHIEFVGDKVIVEGPTLEALQAKEAILNKAKQLNSQKAFFELIVDPKHYPELKRSLGTINRIRTGNNVSLRLPNLDQGLPGHLRIEGSPESVSVAKQQIVEFFFKLENEVTLNLKIANSLIRLLIGLNGRRIKELNSRFPDVSITFPSNKNDNKIENNFKTNINADSLANDKQKISVPAKAMNGGNKNSKDKSATNNNDEKNDGYSEVVIRGPQPHADQCYKYLQLHAQDVADKHHRIELKVPKDLHRLIIGKNGASIKKLCEDTSTRIDLPPTDSANDVIVISGEKSNVTRATNILEAIVKEQSNIVEVAIDLPMGTSSLNKNRLTKSVIESLNTDSSKPEVQIRFNSNNGAVIRGPKDLVEKAKSSLLNVLNEKSFSAEVYAPVSIRGLLIGKNGSALNKITSQHNVDIFFAPEGVDNEVVNIVGEEKEVEAAKQKLAARIENLMSIIETEISIKPKHQKLFLARNRQLIDRICGECGDVVVTFPRVASGSSLVIVKGNKTSVEEAIEKIKDGINKMETAITVECAIPRKYHKILMGAQGNTINQLTRDHDVNIIMPEKKLNVSEDMAKSKQKKSKNKTPKNKPAVESVEINGIENAKNESTADPIGIQETNASSYHSSNGDISAHETGENCGLLDHESAIEENENLDDMPANVKTYTENGDSSILTNNINVTTPSEAKFNGDHNGDKILSDEVDSDEKVSPDDVILIVGQEANCEAAKIAMLAMIPTKKQIKVPKIYHPYIIGPKGANIKQLMLDHRISISLPSSTSTNELITIIGNEKNIASVERAILDKIDAIDENRKTRELRGYSEEVEIDSRHHTKLIGRNGKLINTLSQQFDVNVKFPDRSSDRNNFVLVTGLKENVEKARVELLKKIEDMESQVTEEIELDSRIHPRIIGAKGRTVARLSEEFNVDLKFPGRDATNKNVVVVMGREEHVKECIDHLLDLQEEYLQDINDKEILEEQKRLTTFTSKKKKVPTATLR